MDESAPAVFVMEAGAKAALPVIESMSRAGLRVIAGGESWINSGFFSRHCCERFVYPSPKSRPGEFKGWLLRFLSERRVEVVFPLGHYGALMVAEIQDEIRRYSRMLLPALPVFKRAYEKIPTMWAARRAGVPIPDSWFPSQHRLGLDGVMKLINRWPVLVKPSVGVGARGIVWCYNPDELRRVWPEISEKYGECYLQDFVPPGGMQYKADILVDDSQRLVAGVVYGKTRMYPPNGGSSVLNVSARRADILDLSRRMLIELGWNGFCDFDFVEDPRDGIPKLMEINPRFPESFNMGPSIGIDFPLMIYRMARGEFVEANLDYPADRFLRFFPGDVMWFLRVTNEERFNTWPSWFHFFGPDIKYQLFRSSDPGPIIGYALENMLLLFDRKSMYERLRLGGLGRQGVIRKG